MSNPLDDLSEMPFGKHKGTPMQDVPTNYLHWIYCNFEPQLNNADGARVIDYIDRNLHALKKENSDLIWEKSH